MPCGASSSPTTPRRPGSWGAEGAVHARVLCRAPQQRSRATDPIFILGCRAPAPRCSSRSSPAISLVEGTMELPDHAANRARSRPAGTRLSTRRRSPAVAALAPAELAAWANGISSRYPPLHRKTAAAVLHRQDAQQLAVRRADPSDFAECQDHRRAPASARLLLLGVQAAFRPRPEFFLRPRGLGRYYHDYVALMAHIDRVLPGRVHRVFYER